MTAIFHYVKVLDEDGVFAGRAIFQYGAVSEEKIFLKACEILNLEPEDYSPDDCVFETSANMSETGVVWFKSFEDDEDADDDE